ncbi:hypothetical protein M9458_055670, partial [Cirrhinus mrigala]
TPIEEQADEVMSRLMGRAREVVRVGLRSNPSIDLCKGPSSIFDLLKQHFNDTAYSSMPLADFYGTLPHAGKDPFDYWLRLNRAMDMAEDCLKRENKKTDHLSRELTVMFIIHCADPELSLIFKCRPVEQWTAADVHAHLEEYGREKRCREDCSSIAKPLFNLTTGRKAPRGKWKRRTCQRELCASDWTKECSQAFHKLKQASLYQVLLAHPNFNEPFLLSVDASSNGLGAVLSQIPAGGKMARPVAFASNVLHHLTRVPYSELLAEAADVHTDHVQDVFRWSTHPFDSIPDTEGVAVACHTAKASLLGTMSTQEVEAVLHSCRHSDTNIGPHALLLPHLPQAIKPSDVNVMSHDDLMKRQQKDSVLSRVICFVERVRRPNRREQTNEPATVLKLLKHWGKLLMKNAKVLLAWSGEGCEGLCEVLSSMRDQQDGRAPLENIITTEPLKLICIDIWSPEDSANRSLDVLVVTDHFTRMASAFSCLNQSAKAVAHQLWHNYFCVYGFPSRIHSDRGANFESPLIAELLQVAGVKIKNISLSSDRTLGNMIFDDLGGFRGCLDMKEAMHVAQVSALKQLKRHADLYSRKGARGKQKLADLWEDTTHAVVGLNKDSHTYRIQHSRTGVVKTVHCNLIMPVNFLPLTDDGLEGDATENYLSDSESVDSVVADVSEDAANYRTQEWVSQLPSDGMNDPDTDDVEEPTDVLESIQDVDTAQSNELEHDVINISETTQLGPEGLDDVAGMDKSVPESTTEQVEISLPAPSSAAMPNGSHLAEANSVSNISVCNFPAESSLSRVTSRAGRLFKPVTRFTEIMNQQKVLG